MSNKKLVYTLTYSRHTPVSKAAFSYSFFTYPSVFKWEEIQHMLVCEENLSFVSKNLEQFLGTHSVN